ncbi:MAG TPA: 2'-5' RNA ligase family protein [Candidatus Paceibacterota bacterium]|nr:2'-5' RNA ligase family protein [Candidatus Paceibacterota bacterium]
MNEEKRKVFLALRVPDEIKYNVTEVKNKYHNFPVRWNSDKDLHITVIAPWLEGDIPALLEKLKGIEGKVGRINILFDTVAYGPNNFSPRLIWTTGDVPQKILDLRVMLKDALAITNFRNDFFTHLTLARFEPADIERMPMRRIREEVRWRGVADTLLLIESKPGTGGPDYEVLAEIKL